MPAALFEVFASTPAPGPVSPLRRVPRCRAANKPVGMKLDDKGGGRPDRFDQTRSSSARAVREGLPNYRAAFLVAVDIRKKGQSQALRLRRFLLCLRIHRESAVQRGQPRSFVLPEGRRFPTVRSPFRELPEAIPHGSLRARLEFWCQSRPTDHRISNLQIYTSSLMVAQEE